MLYLLLTLTLFQTQESPHYEGWLIIQADAGDCPDAYENLGAMAWLTWEDHRANGYVYFDDGTIAKVEGDSLTFPSAVAAEAESYKLEWLKEEGSFKIVFTPVHQSPDPCAWKQAFLRLMKAKEPGHSPPEWLNEYQAIVLMTEVNHDLARGITTNALTRLRRALVLSPFNPDIHLTLSWFASKDPVAFPSSLMEEAINAENANQPDLAYAYKATLALLFNTVGDQALSDKNYEKALEFYQNALKLTPSHHMTLAKAGIAYDRLGCHDEALAWLQKAVTAATTENQIKFNAKTINHRVINLCHTAISYTLEVIPDWAKAKSQAASVLPDTPIIAEAREKWEKINQHVLNAQMNGEYITGLALAVEALTLAEKHFGENHPNYIKSLHNLALLHVSQGAYQKAQRLYEQALQISRDVLGERHPNTLTSMNNLAGLYTRQGAYSQAQPLYEQALQMSRDVLGEQHTITLTSTNNLSVLYQSLEAYQKAQLLAERTYQLSRNMLGEHHPDTLKILTNLANLYYRQGAYQKTELLFEQVLMLKRDVFSDRHPDTLSTLHNLAVLYKKNGNYKAVPLLKWTLQLFRDVLGERHPYTLTSINSLAAVYESHGDYQKAHPLLEQVLTLSRDVLGEHHPDTLRSLQNLALLFLHGGDQEQSELLLNQYLFESNQFISQIIGFSTPLRRSFIGQQDSFKNIYLTVLTQSLSSEAQLNLLAFSLQRKGLLYNLLDNHEDHQDQTEQQDQLNHLRQQLARDVTSGVHTGYQNEIEQLEASLGKNRKLETQIHPYQIFAAMPASSCLIDLHVFTNANFKTLEGPLEILALVIDPQAQEAVRVVMLGSLEALEDDLTPFLTSVSSPGKRSLSQKSARALYQKLWLPLAPYLTDKETVYLSADGILNRLPFGALIDEQGCWLAEKHKLHLLISPRDLLKTHSGKANAPVVVYAPDYEALPQNPDPKTLPATGRLFNQLPGALVEGQMLTTAFSRAGKPAQELTAAAATEAAVSALQAPAILHIASHGIYLNGEKSLGPTRSGKDSAGRQRELISGDDKAPPPVSTTGPTSTRPSPWPEPTRPRAASRPPTRPMACSPALKYSP